MRIKWLVILVTLYIGIVLISLLFTPKNSKLIVSSQKEIPIAERPEDVIQPFSTPAKAPALVSASLPLTKKSGITIIKTPILEAENIITPATEIKEGVVNNLSSRSVSLNTKTEDDTQQAAGITKIGKQPSPKETKEMNSNGIVLY